MLLLLAAASGCAALVYEIVWFQLLQLVIGSSTVSLGVLLASYMGGLCVGSLLLPRWVSLGRDPLQVFAGLEFGIGLWGLLVWWGMPLLDRVYVAGLGQGWPGIAWRAVVCAICLLPATLLMGASLPSLARCLDATPLGVSRIGRLYGANLAGAVAGCLLAGFYLLRVFDMATATWSAAALNAAAALAALWLARRIPWTPREAAAGLTPGGAHAVLAAIALSGLSGLGAEVVWTRLLSLMLGATVYTFSIILAVFLTGLGLGSILGAKRLQPRDARAALGLCQLALAAAILWAAFALAALVPYWPLPGIGSTAARRFGVDMLRTACALLPAAVLWGASFPLALAAAAQPGHDLGRLVGRIYTANTLGAIAGALGFSVLAIPAIGTQNGQRLLIGLAAAGAALVLPPLVRWMGLAVGFGLLWFVPAVPWGVFAYGRQMTAHHDPGRPLYVGEGINSSIAVSELQDHRQFHVSGKVEASGDQQDMRLQLMLGHLPALFHPQPRTVLVVGCGAGVTAGTFVLHPGVERIVICEIEPLVPKAAARFFGKENHDVLQDPRVRVVIDDARHFILTTNEKFDVITSDPIHPWVRGSATLYTGEYFDLCKRRLNPGGIVTQWVPLYESDRETVRSEIATFFSAFPHGTLWANDTIFAGGYDTVLLGGEGAAHIDMAGLEHRLDCPGYVRVSNSLKHVGLGSALSILSTYSGQAADLETWLRGAQINRDRNLRLQYLAGMHPESQGADTIYWEMLKHRRYPDRLITGAGAREAALREALR